MIKRIVLALTFAAVCASAQARVYKDGTYIGEGNGNASKIQVEVVVFHVGLTGPAAKSAGTGAPGPEVVSGAPGAVF